MRSFETTWFCSRAPAAGLVLAVALALLEAPATDAAPRVRARLADNVLSFTPEVANSGMMLRIAGPVGLVFEREFSPGASPSVLLSELSGGDDGAYTWELTLYPDLDNDVRERLRQARADEAMRQSGHFRVRDGVIVNGDLIEDQGGPHSFAHAVGPAAGPTAHVEADRVISDDLIVIGSQCVGRDCVDGEVFGTDTLRLKQNNLRIRLEDTSAAPGFPSGDWQITVNDSSNGGADRFSVEDVSLGRTPFTLRGSAPAQSLFVDDSGNIGFGTVIPRKELHVIDGDSPALRLEQDGSSGFTPQTWDVAGSETIFYVRDVTNGSALPLQIRPEAPDSSLVIASSGDVGLGTSEPEAPLHIFDPNPLIRLGPWDLRANSGGFRVRAPSTGQFFRIHPLAPESSLTIDSDGDVGLGSSEPQAALHVEDDSGPERRIAHFQNNGSMRMRFENTAGTHWTLRFNDDGLDITSSASSGSQLNVSTAGDLTVPGSVTANSGMSTLPDYVFEEGYPLMPLDELKHFVTAHKHLPNIPSREDVEEAGGKIDMTELQRLLLEKVEELTLYAFSLQESLAGLEDENAALEARLEAMESPPLGAPAESISKGDLL